MAKLTGTKVIDMTGGEITAIKYDGTVYTKVADKAMLSDIVRTLNGAKDVTTGAYYSVSVPDENGDAAIRDDVYDKRSSLDRFEVFRKASAPPQASAPFAEMVVNRVEAVEQRMDALEGAKGTETLVKGDRVLISGRSIVGTDTDGKFGRYYRISDVAGLLVTVDGYGRLFRREQLTKVAGTEALKVGDYAVVITKNSELSGKVVEVRKEDAVAYDFRCYTLCGAENALYNAHELRKATDAEVAAATAPPKPKTGDIVVIMANTNGSRNKVGDIGKVSSELGDNGKAVRVIVVGATSSANFTRYNEMRLATPAEIAKYEAEAAEAARDSVFTKAGRKPNEYRGGDVVRVTRKDGEACNFVGVVETVAPRAIGVRNEPGYKGVWFGEGDTAEIVCFAENRADLAKGAC